jgi:hypothetical protein
MSFSVRDSELIIYRVGIWRSCAHLYFKLINMQSVTLRAHRPAYSSFAFFTGDNNDVQRKACLVWEKNPRKCTSVK